MNLKDSKIVFFDGVCTLCNGFVDFLITRDNEGNLKFASLQGETAKQVLGAVTQLDSIVFFDKGQTYTQSTAVLKIAKQLSSKWKWLSLLLILPRPLRDFFYRIVARNRYKWFGEKDSCRMPTPEEVGRILP